MIHWDEANRVLLDSMGYPLSKSDVTLLVSYAEEHLRKSPADLAAIANKKLKQEMPHYDPFEPEKYE